MKKRLDWGKQSDAEIMSQLPQKNVSLEHVEFPNDLPNIAELIARDQAQQAQQLKTNDQRYNRYLSETFTKLQQDGIPIIHSSYIKNGVVVFDEDPAFASLHIHQGVIKSEELTSFRKKFLPPKHQDTPFGDLSGQDQKNLVDGFLGRPNAIVYNELQKPDRVNLLTNFFNRLKTK